MGTLQGKGANRQIATYAADHGVAFPNLLNTDEGQLQHMKLCLLSLKTNRTASTVLKWFEAHIQ